jgi:hypothetical protein
MVYFSLLIVAYSSSGLSQEVDASISDDLMGESEFDESDYLEPLDEIDYKDEDESKFTQVDPDLLEDDFPDIKFDTINKIQENDVNTEEIIRKIIIPKSKRKYSYAEKEALKIGLKDIVKSGTFIGVIRRGTRLVHLRTGKLHYNQRLITVKAYKKNDYEGYKLLINKNGFSTYKVLSNQLESIKVISKLYEAPDKYQEVSKKLDYRTADTKVNLRGQFNIHIGVSQSQFLKELGRVNSNIGQTTRYEGQFYSQFKFPVLLGFTTNYENTFANFSNGGSYSMTSLSLGPMAKTKPYLWGEAEYTFFSQVRHAIFSKATVKSPTFSGDFNLSQTSFVLGGERKVKSFLGNIMIGFNYQRQWLKPSSKNLSANFNSENTISDAFVLSFGYQKDIL